MKLRGLKNSIAAPDEFDIDAVDMLPDAECDLNALRDDIITYDMSIAIKPGRGSLRNHSNRIERGQNGKPRLLWLHVLCMAYLRRHTLMEGKAKHLFHRIWDEHPDFMVKTCGLRYLISALQTFHDHPSRPEQRAGAGMAVVWANMVKLHEADVHMLHPNGPPPFASLEPNLPGVPKLGTFQIGGDLRQNTNRLVLKAAMEDPIVGKITERVMGYVARGDTFFARWDAAKDDVDLPPGIDWSTSF